MLRTVVRSGNELGKIVDEIMKNGELVPDDIVIELIENAIY